MSNTRIASYREVKRDGTGLTQQGRIVRFLTTWGPSIKDTIASGLTLRHSSVTARLNELVAAGKVRKSDIVWNPDTSRHVTQYAVDGAGYACGR